jgi:hypothetical protein
MNTSSLRAAGFTLPLASALLLAQPFNTHAERKPITLPPQASEIAEGIFDLGFARGSDGKIVHGVAHIHYMEQFASKGGGKPPAKPTTCYAILWPNTKWMVEEPYVYNWQEDGAADKLLNMELAISTWETAAGNKPILGPGELGTVYPKLVGTYNELNEVMVGDLSSMGSGVIAVTYTWHDGAGQLVEWDMVFGDTWTWSLTEACPSDAMDFLNIATHELGHAIGLGHPKRTCIDETMYAYARLGETKKRDLNAGDIAGIKALYP